MLTDLNDRPIRRQIEIGRKKFRPAALLLLLLTAIHPARERKILLCRDDSHRWKGEVPGRGICRMRYEYPAMYGLFLRLDESADRASAAPPDFSRSPSPMPIHCARRASKLAALSSFTACPIGLTDYGIRGAKGEGDGARDC
ncbi:hypothetical protein KM043_000958 [Ampulex compressa]|nr:hypothetical protein KM043_000958 [Ampulex compressa]